MDGRRRPIHVGWRWTTNLFSASFYHRSVGFVSAISLNRTEVLGRLVIGRLVIGRLVIRTIGHTDDWSYGRLVIGPVSLRS